MFTSATSSSSHVTVYGDYPPSIYNSGGMNVGQLRYNTSTQSTEVFDGNTWRQLSQGITIGLSWEAESAIQWAIEKKKEEELLKQRLDQHPGLKDAWEKFQIMDALCKDNDEQSV